jgi:Leucine-rich repeat (LRR) protein
MNIYVDIDETICFYNRVDRLGYKEAIPSIENISKINKLYDEGNIITYYTGRGTVSKIDYYDLTKEQLEKWECKYHELSVGEKPNYDLLICDKTKRIEEI